MKPLLYGQLTHSTKLESMRILTLDPRYRDSSSAELLVVHYGREASAKRSFEGKKNMSNCHGVTNTTLNTLLYWTVVGI